MGVTTPWLGLGATEEDNVSKGSTFSEGKSARPVPGLLVRKV